MRTRCRLSLAGVFMLFMLFLGAKQGYAAPPQYALVIGNASYAQRPLANPHRDAALMTETLQKLGFEVTQQLDVAERKDFYNVVSAFTERLPKGAVALVYYAGHGMQINEANYLQPTKMTLTSETNATQRSYPLQAMLDKLQGGKSVVNIVVLDACRDNPFRPVGKYRGLAQQGLASMVSPQGMVIAYASAPGQPAPDGLGRNNSVYTEVLAAEMQKTGLSIENILKNVAATVRRKTFEDQQPWYAQSLVDDYYFLPPDGVRVVTRAKPTQVAMHGKTGTRGAGDEVLSSSEWYMQLGRKEWTLFDKEIEQRVKRFSRDELPQLEMRAETGNVVAQTTLGIVYREGLDRMVESGSGSAAGRTFRSNPNNTLSLAWLSRAAEAGFPMAQVELGEMYYAGHGVDRDREEARRWLERAARADYPRAQINLAQIKAENSGSPAAMQELLKTLFQHSFSVNQPAVGQ